MKIPFTRSLALLALGLAVIAPPAFALSPSALSQSPLFLVQSAEPLVMLNLSNDHQLYFKAYDDYSDLDGDGTQDITYTHAIDYYGYFDPYKCYTYDSAQGRFEPQAVTSDKYCDAVSGDWSGNFLNWVSMTRMDAVRKILYGGYRSTDTASDTVLERSYIPSDAHSFAKYYAEADLAKLTPYSLSTYSSGVTICNTTYDGTSGRLSQDSTQPPLMRIANGNFSLWINHEKRQCQWREDSNTVNNNNSGVTGISAPSRNPYRATDRIAELKVRVQACVSGLKEQNCKTYPAGGAKPTGLLQTYGEDEQIYFGLITGSYDKNKSGGVLRKNVKSFADEVDASTGQFLAAPTNGGIVDTLDRLRISNFEYGDNDYLGPDSCGFAKYSFTDGECSNWGNPQSEIFLEGLRYFAGLGKTSAFDASDSSYINGLSQATWADPLSNDNYCAPVKVIQFNASVSSYDGDQMGGFSDLHGSPSIATQTNLVGAGEGIGAGSTYFIGSNGINTNRACTEKTLSGLADAEGNCPEAPWLEGTFDIAGAAYFSHVNSIRNDLTDVSGSAAEINVDTYGVALSPALPSITVPVPGGNSKVIILPACMEYRGSLHNGNCAIVDFKVVTPHTLSADGRTATGKFMITWESAQQGGDYDQDLAGIIEYEIGPDVDTNSSGVEIRVTTDTYAESTGALHGFGYVISGTTQDGLHIHSGSDGFSAYADPYGDPDCAPGGCNIGDAATSRVYYLGNSTGIQLKTPLYYAAKWGGFEEDLLDTANGGTRPVGDALPNDTPDQAYEWDANGDGLPDTYFYSTNPSELETSLAAVFLGVAQQIGASSSTAANSQRVSTDTTIYQSRFDSSNWSGELLAYQVNITTGALSTVPNWDAGANLQSVTPSSRYVISYLPGTGGIPFSWNSMDSTQQGYLNVEPDTLATDTLGDERVDYLRGDTSNEVQSGGAFRDRARILGDLINSSPAYVGTPGFGYPDWLEFGENSSAETYSAFKARLAALNSNTGRTEMLYVGGNDGMLHGFTAASSAVTGGVEKLAYVPNVLYPVLNQLTSPDYSHQYYVDGTPTVGDVMFSDNYWHTMLVSGLNAGGKGIFALDVTNPASFTTANVGSVVLWEISSDTTGFAELGYTFSRPALVKNHAGTDPYNYASGDGKWISVFGNGYASASGHAILYIVDAQTGAKIDEVVAENVSGDNGLSTVSPVDIDGDYKIDVIYAGDLKGNIWKFIPDGTQTGWKVDFGNCDGGATTACNPLFTGPSDPTSTITNTQPVTARIEVGRHPAGKPGVMVYFGTGSYFKVGDNVASSDRDSVYGIWDAWDDCTTYDTANNIGARRSACISSYRVGGASPPSVPAISRSNLLKQCVTTGTTADVCKALATTSTSGDVLTGTVSSTEVRVISDQPLNQWHWTAASGYMGWYIDMPDYGEKQVTRHILRAGRLIFVSIIPSDHSCKDGGESWLWEIDPLNGGRLAVTAFDINGDGVFDSNDDFQSGSGNPFLKVSAKKSPTGIIQPPSIVTSPDGSKEYKYSSSSAGNIELTTENPDKMARGRKSWIRID